MKMTSVEYDQSVDLHDDLCEDVNRYERLIGKLLYLTNTRPYITFAVQSLSQFMQQPKVSHWDAALRVVRYIKGDPGKGLLLSSNQKPQLTGFCDADWAACPNTKRTVTGSILKFGDYLISWKSKK